MVRFIIGQRSGQVADLTDRLIDCLFYGVVRVMGRLFVCCCLIYVVGLDGGRSGDLGKSEINVGKGMGGSSINYNGVIYD